MRPVQYRASAFRFHLAALDVREHSRVHERAVAALLSFAGVEDDYLSVPEQGRIELLASELANRRPLAPVEARLRARSGSGARLPEGDPRGAWALRGRGGRQLYRLHDRRRLRRTRSAGAGQAGWHERSRRHPAIRNAGRPRARPPGAGRPVCPAELSQARRTPGPARGDDRLLGLQQGRGFPDGQLGALPRPGGGRPGVSRSRGAAADLSRPRHQHRGAVADRRARPFWRSRRARWVAACA